VIYYVYRGRKRWEKRLTDFASRKSEELLSEKKWKELRLRGAAILMSDVTKEKRKKKTSPLYSGEKQRVVRGKRW